MVANPLEQLSLRSVPNLEFNRYSPVTAILKAMPIQNGLFEHWKKIWFGQGCLILSPISRRLWMYGKKNIMRIILSHHQVTWRLMNTKDGFIHLPHKRETGGINNSQKMKSAFFDCFYVIAPLKKGVHYTRLSSVIIQKQMCAKLRTLPKLLIGLPVIKMMNFSHLELPFFRIVISGNKWFCFSVKNRWLFSPCS